MILVQTFFFSFSCQFIAKILVLELMRRLWLALHNVGLQFGEVDIDGSLVASRQQGDEDIVMLNNGCLCCTVRGDLVRMLGDLVTKKGGKFDHIIIETTGQ